MRFPNMFKKLFRLPRKRSEKPIKVGQYWVAKEGSNKSGTIKKVFKVSNTSVEVSSSKGFNGKVCISEFLDEFEIHKELSNISDPKMSINLG